MQEKEIRWKKAKIGLVSCSSLHLLDSKSGSWTDTNISYLYKLQRQRVLNQPAPPIFSRNLNTGTENEPYAVAWLRENTPMNIKHCSEDFDDIVFIKTDFGLGCSPDVYEYALDWKKIISVIEIKCVTAETTTNFYFSPTISYDIKRITAFDEHRCQLAGQLLAHPEINVVKLLKYDPQNDEDEFDIRDVTDPTRGILFTYTRSEFGEYLNYLKQRIITAEAVLKSGQDISTLLKKNK